MSIIYTLNFNYIIGVFKMMKKLLVFAIVFLMLSSSAFADGESGAPEVTGANPDNPGQGPSGDVGPQPDNPGEIQQIQAREQVRTQLEEVKQMMQQRQQQMNAEAQGAGDKNQEMMRNQNQVRIAAQTLSQMANMMGGIGPQVSSIAKNFNNSVQATINAEEKIQTRSSIARFFTGGDAKAAADIDAQVIQNRQRIQELKQLKDQCDDCDEEVKAMMQEQIQLMDQEQTRLTGLAQAEKKSKGLLGWLWK